MNALVILNFIGGNLETGFAAVTAQIMIESEDRSMQFRGSLPPAPEIIQCYKRWQLLYESLYDRSIRSRQSRSFSVFEIEADDITNISEVDFEELVAEFALIHPSRSQITNRLRSQR